MLASYLYHFPHLKNEVQATREVDSVVASNYRRYTDALVKQWAKIWQLAMHNR